MSKTVHPYVAGERRDLVAVLERLNEEQWAAPSLCAGWRVREVVAHTTTAYRYSLPKILFALLKARGNINRAADACARADTRTLTDAELLASLRANIEHPWQPPRGGPAGTLWHEVIHGLDITVALGLDRRVPDERISMMLEALQPAQVDFFGADLSGVRLQADDRDWSYGTGSVVTGAAQHLLLVLTGRMVPPGLLSGEQSARFTAPVPSSPPGPPPDAPAAHDRNGRAARRPRR
ncbi:maleylpyruvate isomerase family mycothiol-dependent enzyme [Rhodococcus chondri]|uniref:Maleylpyruvate isomerase family mycothiol-dependent enzyme n=1 Tax=Rhodococcus chondri TaxID=3065941 RepID=A0ABU7JMA1_9NOCA|nr:maleylpyruvate isomerase family mycothiol-dependent enzyme [Rhodococcus sp. CC-R104]MEE2030940.1 maleylpyruvate isomerase family mycothiol-dependent enzyme [Rhodococcus sp. CC-R104]